MKRNRILAILLVLCCFATLVGCGKTRCSADGCKSAAVEDDVYGELYCEEHLADRKAFDISKKAFEKIQSAYAIASDFSDDVYEAWLMAIFNDDDILESGTAYMVKNLHIDEHNLIDGLLHATADLTGSDDITNINEDTYELISEYSNSFFKLVKSGLYTFCVRVIVSAYAVNGEAEQAEAALNEATDLMKELNEKYADYEHYPKLKELLTQVSALLDFCNEPEGSFEQVKLTLNDYKNDIRDLTNDLDYIFAK